MDLSLQIPKDNKGYQLLLKMGYRAGLGLGKNSDGIQSPVRVHFKNDRRGLGMELGQEKRKESYKIQHIDTNLDTAKEFVTNSSKMETEFLHPHWNLDDDWDTDEDGNMNEDQNTEKARHMDPDWDKTEDWDEENDASEKLMQMAQENNDLNSITQSNDDYETDEDWDKDEDESKAYRSHNTRNEYRGLEAPNQYMDGVLENKSDTHTQHQDDNECKGDFDAHENMQMKNKQTCLSVPDSIIELAQENLKDKSMAWNGEKSSNQDCDMDGSLNNQEDCCAIQNRGDGQRDIQNENMNIAAPRQLMALCNETNGDGTMDQVEANDLNTANVPGYNCIEMETEQGQEFWDTDEESVIDVFKDLHNISDEEYQLFIGGSIVYF